MKRLLILFALTYLFTMPVCALASGFEVDGMKYEIMNSTERTVQLVDGKSKSGNVIIPDNIMYNGVKYTVTSIGPQAFQNCNAIKSVVIPEQVRSLDSAFSGCTSLESVKINGGSSLSDTFSGCINLKDVTLSENTSLDYTFHNCTSLKKIIIPPNTDIGMGTFSGCTSLEEIVFPNDLDYIGEYVFSGCTSLNKLVIPAGVDYIGKNAFKGCNGLQEITVPDLSSQGVSSLGGPLAISGLNELPKLKKISIAEGEKTISDRLFDKITKPLTVILPSTLESIGNYAFYGCAGLKELDIPKSVTSIGSGAFSDCSGLTNMIIPEGIKSVSSGMFSQCSGLTSVVLPDGVEEIGASAFYECSNLKYINLPSPLKTIGYNAFGGCQDLESITIPSGIELIDERAFRSCKSLKSLEIPPNVKTIGMDAFFGCDSLEKISFPAYTNSNDLGLTNNKMLREVTVTGTVKSLPANMFRDMSQLKKVTLNATLESIGDSAFYGCTSLSELNIPQSVTSIGTGAFVVSGLKTMMFNSMVAPKLQSLGGIFPAGVTIIVSEGATGYTQENGWPIIETGEGNGGSACDICTTPECTVVKQGNTYVFTVKMASQNAAYQWQSSKDGVHFTDIAGETDKTMTMKATGATKGLSVRCVVLPCSNVIFLDGGTADDSYPILNGADSIWSGLGSQIVRVDAEHHKFVSASVNGLNLIKGRDYHTRSGSTIVELTPEYLTSLSPGMYTLNMEFTDGKAETTFTIPAPAETESLPDTGDQSRLASWVMLSALALSFYVGFLKKKIA